MPGPSARQTASQANAAKYNATVLQQQGIAETNSAASNMNMSTRKSAAELGTQGAAIGQANIGTGGSGQAVEQQSAKEGRMDALNIWYGDELEKHQADAAAQEQLYNAKIYSSNAKAELVKGGFGAGTALLMGGAKAYGAANGINPVDMWGAN